mmetsp:Transcript_3074/g.4325  ORF Transcript_3074/g.4325 Transcript_3074/m.4325 type:complete len:277 (+) Transcript_3074:147-977(+)|eukprot:CAMPEP_0184867086 /NCGR_PEP_ID=MMETSP0580-20130426/25036_1 /TAXON_ID=1118495 /ORGANISM="Dactyliosolen fragilissimus" /LENGTH=276 /DNA_ID=CAMNT_0027367133 /DNA_START=104 /DNA_END=934 /DNA_ORIENTATION=+
MICNYVSISLALFLLLSHRSQGFKSPCVPLRISIPVVKGNAFSNSLMMALEKPYDQSDDRNDITSSSLRRNFIENIATVVTINTIALTNSPLPSYAGIDPSSLSSFRTEGDDAGTTTRLRQIENIRNKPEDSLNIPYEELPNGISYREYREGKGEAVIVPGSKVAVEMTIRCKSFATANEPGGVKYFSTKEDTDFNEFAWTVGSGEIFPELEEAMMGMHRGALRRIDIPSTIVFAAKKDNQLPLPSENNKEGKRRFQNLFKTDASLIFEILVTRIK